MNRRQRVIISLLAVIFLTTSVWAAEKPGGSELTIGIGVGVNRLMPGEHGWTELMDAVLNGNADAVRDMLKKKVDVNARNNRGGTALMVALDNGHKDIVHLLLNAGADVNIQDKDGMTALSIAVYRGYADIVKVLLDKGADLNARGYGVRSILDIASEKGSTEIVQALLEKGADVKKYGGMAIISASRNGHTDIVELLIVRGGDVNAQGHDGKIALSYAVERDDMATVRLLLDKGADVKRYGGEALLSAASNGSAPIIQSLLDKGVDVNTKDKYGKTALILAAQKGHEDTVKILLKNGADVKATDDQGQTALVYADWENHKAVVDILLTKETLGPQALSLVYIQEDKNKCDLKMWNPTTQATKLLHSLKDCPKDLYVDDDKNAMFVIKGNTVQEIIFRPKVIIKPARELPFKEGKVDVKGEQHWNSLSRVGYLKDGRLSVINERVRPTDDSDIFLYALDNDKWSLIAQRYCRRFEDCTLGPISGHSWREWKRENQIWHSILSMNPFVIERGMAPHMGDDKSKRRQGGEMRYIKFSISGRKSILYYDAQEGDHSFGPYTFSIYLKTDKDEAPVKLSDVQSNTAIEHKYLLLNRYFREGLDLIDLESGKRLLKGLRFAFWIY